MTDAQNQTTIIGDSGPLIALAIIGQLDLLRLLYQQVIIPQMVWDEVTVHGQGLAGALEVSRLTWVQIKTPQIQWLAPLTVLVDKGEAQAIALALSEANSTVLLDDAQARRVAERFGVGRIGTLGILRKAKKAGYITQIKPYIEQLQRSGIYIKQTLIDAVLHDVGE